MKKILLVSIFFIFVGFVPLVFAADPKGFTALAPIPGLTGPGVTDIVNSTSLANFFNNLYKYLVGLAAVLAVIMIIWGGFEISTKDSISKQSDGRKKIQDAILGLVLVLSPVLVFSIINPSILNLSLNLEPLKTTTGSIAGDFGAGGTPIDSGVTGCTANKGPSDGTYLVTCTASAPDASGATSKGDLKSTAEAKVEESLGSAGIDCIEKSDKKWNIVSNVCPENTRKQGNINVKICTIATATAWCSPIVTTNFVKKAGFEDLLYYPEDAPGAIFASACAIPPVPSWEIVHEHSFLESDKATECPTNNQKYTEIQSQYGDITQCASSLVYCKYND